MDKLGVTWRPVVQEGEALLHRLREVVSTADSREQP
jgi:hypothetical protein